MNKFNNIILDSESREKCVLGFTMIYVCFLLLQSVDICSTKNPIINFKKGFCKNVMSVDALVLSFYDFSCSFP